MSIDYRPWQEDDDLRLLELWPDVESAPVQAFRARLGAQDHSGWSTTLVATDDGVPVAAGVCYASAWHPQRLWLSVEVAPDHRREGIGRELVDRLREAAREDGAPVQALRTRVAPESTGEGFARSLGFRDAMRSRVVRVDAGALPAPTLGKNPDGSDAESVADLATGSVELTRAVEAFYRAVHEWDPVGDVSIGAFNKQFLSDTAGAYGAVVLRRAEDGTEGKGPIAAFAVSYRPFDPANPHDEPLPNEVADVLLGYVPGAAGATAAQAGAALETLLALLVGDYPVELEVDDSMGPLVTVVDNLLDAGVARVVTETETLVLD
ncbi:GNAT family N-acetyltransferase [Kocuria sp.]|uniref:GNAT family N-acetyltransferase n=1 Tax=Kocuria sp. TaxID=1871328 RepID=UPI0026DBCE47|nr:GNAT family N-acetyltransferase [Kocuria sp.]MDO4920033.1 GNAT family N-acetyltransferase [Kocuria sp.]